MTTDDIRFQEIADKEVISAVPALDISVDKYQSYLEDFNLTDSQEREFLETLWSIMASFVEMGFSVDICAQLFKEFNEVSDAESSGVQLPNSTTAETPSPDCGKETSS